MCLFTGNTPLSLTETGWQFHGRVLWSDGDIFLGHIKKIFGCISDEQSAWLIIQVCISKMYKPDEK